MKPIEIKFSAGGKQVVGGDLDDRDEPWVYLDLESKKILKLSGDEAFQSKEWHLAFKRSLVRINGGSGGISDVGVSSIFNVDDMGRDDFLALGDIDFKKFFSIAGVSSISEPQFQGDAIRPCIDNWWKVRDGRTFPNLLRGWKLRLHDGISFAKMMVTGCGDAGSYADIKYGFQPSADSLMGEDLSIKLSDGDSFNFKTGSKDSGNGWDIKLSGGDLFTNSSVSGSGNGGAIGSRKYSAFFDDIKSASDAPAFFMDDHGKFFRVYKWYRYNLMGDHRLHLNGNVYLIRYGGSYWKFQIFGYYQDGEKSSFGSYSVRFCQIEI